MANEIIITLHPENDENTNLYPNIKKENIPNGSVDTYKLSSSVLNLIAGLDQPKYYATLPTSNVGLIVYSDGYIYSWDSATSQYVNTNILYQATKIANDSVYIPMIEPKLRNFLLDNCYIDELTHTTTIGSFINKYTHQVQSYNDSVLLVADVSNVSTVLVTAYLFGDLESYSFWDSNDTYIANSSVILSSGQSTDVLVTIPSNAKYIKVSSKRTSANYGIKYYTLLPKISSDEVAYTINDLQQYYDYVEEDITFTLGYVTYNGVINTDYSYFFNTKVYCKYGDKIKYSTKANGQGLFAITYYDENDNFIAQEGRNAGVVTDVEVTINYEECAYVRISTGDRTLTSVSIYKFDYSMQNSTVKECESASLMKTAINQKLGYLNYGRMVITVDDGDDYNPTYVFPLINTYNIPIVFACWTTSYIIQNNLSDLLSFITNKNCEIAQHTASSFINKTITESYGSLKREKETFSSLGIEVKNYCYGYNQYDDNLMFVASALYDYACAGVGHNNTPANKKYALERTWITWGSTNSFKNRIDRCKNNNELLIIGVHAGELSDAETYQKLKDIIEYAQQENVPITNLSSINDLY